LLRKIFSEKAEVRRNTKDYVSENTLISGKLALDRSHMDFQTRFLTDACSTGFAVSTVFKTRFLTDACSTGCFLRLVTGGCVSKIFVGYGRPGQYCTTAILQEIITFGGFCHPSW